MILSVISREFLVSIGLTIGARERPTAPLARGSVHSAAQEIFQSCSLQVGCMAEQTVASAAAVSYAGAGGSTTGTGSAIFPAAEVEATSSSPARCRISVTRLVNAGSSQRAARMILPLFNAAS